MLRATLPWGPVPAPNVTLGFTPVAGDSFYIVNFTGGLTGTFNGLSNNAFLQVGNSVFQITYNAHNVELLCVLADIWNGSLMTAGATGTTGTMACPSTARISSFQLRPAISQTTSDIAGLTSINSITFTGTGYSLNSAYPITLQNGLTNNAGGTNSYGLSTTTLAAPQTIWNNGTLNLTNTLNLNGNDLTFDQAAGPLLSAAPALSQGLATSSCRAATWCWPLPTAATRATPPSPTFQVLQAAPSSCKTAWPWVRPAL